LKGGGGRKLYLIKHGQDMPKVLNWQWTPVAPIIVGHPNSAPAPVSHKAPEIRWIG
jgi:hypothetical protein